MSYSYDDVYVLHAWRDNRRHLVLTQGEGYSGTLSGNYMVKAPHFQLMDQRDIISIPSDTAVSMAITLPNGTEDLIACYPVDKPNGIFCCPIRTTMTSLEGEVKGEVRLTTANNTVIKFYGIIFYVYDGVSNSAIAQSPAFSALDEALSKVEAVTTSGTTIAPLDGVIQAGGQHPATSGVIYNFVNNNYIRYRACSGSEIDTANDAQCIYVHNSNGFRGLVFFTGYNNYSGVTTVTQFRICKSGRFEYRTGTVASTSAPNTYTWDKAYNEDWNPIGSTQNIQDSAVTTAKINNLAVTEAKLANSAVTTNKIANANVTPSKLDRAYVEKSAAIAGVEIQDGVSLNDLLTAILGTTVTATQNNPVAGRTIFQFLLDNYVGFKTTYDPNTAKDSHTLYIDGTGNNDLIFVIPSSTRITQYKLLADGTVKSRYCPATDGVQTGSWQNWVALVSTDNIQDGAITPEKLDRQYGRIINCSGNEIDTANDSQAIYIHHVGGFKGLVFFTGYNNYSGETTVKQFRLCWSGRFEYRIGTVITPTTSPNTYTWDKSYNEDWHPIGSTQNIQDDAITNDKLADNAVDTAQIKNKAVTKAKIADGAVDTAQLAYAAVTNDNIDSNAVNTEELVDNAITTAKINNNAVTTVKIADGNVTLDKLNANVKESTPTQNSNKLLTSGGAYQALQNYNTLLANKIVVFTFTLDKDDWLNKQQVVDLPISYVATGDTIADVDVGSTAYNQLIADGCTGIYISSTYSNSTLSLMANALGNAPVHDIDIQVTLTAVTDMSA